MAADSVSRPARLALLLTLAVVLAAAGIRHGVDASVLRPVHRVAATLVVPLALWMVWKSFRAATLLALALTVALAVVGVVGGRTPAAWAVLANLLGGLALAAAFASIAAGSGERGPAAPAILLAVQVLLGAWLSVSGGVPAQAAHGLLAMLVAAVLGWYALARVKGGAGKLLFAAAIATPLAGMTALQHESAPLAALAHAGFAALLVCGAAYALSRRA